MTVSVSIQLPDPEMNFDDFEATLIELKEQEVGLTNQVIGLAAVAVRRGWAEAMAEVWGVARTTIYDWAAVGEAFPDGISSDVPLWLYVASARLAKRATDSSRFREVSNAVFTYCVANGITPSEMMAVLNRGAPPVAITGDAIAEYPQNRIVLTPDKPPAIRPQRVHFRLVSAEPGAGIASQEVLDAEELIRRVLGTGTAETKTETPV